MSSSGCVNLALTALANATQTAAVQLSSAAFLNQITVCTATNNSCLLPANPVNGQVCKVRNDSAAVASVQTPLNIFPQVGGQINALAVNAAFTVQQGGLVEFIASGSLTWLIGNCSYSSNIQPMQNTTTIADQAGVALTLTTAQAGVVKIAAQSVALTLNIPTAVGNAGLHYRCELTGIAGQTITVTPAAGTCSGLLANNVPAAVTCLVCTAKANVAFTAAATAGSWVDFVSDGTNYTVYASGTLSGIGWA